MPRSKKAAAEAVNDDACSAVSESAAEPAPALVAYKGYNKDLTCNPAGVPFQYEIGKTYDNGDKPVRRCGNGGFHSVEMPQDMFTYYPPVTSRYTIVRPGGDIAREEGSDTKIASAKITIGVELHLGDIARRAVEWVAAMANKQGNGSHAAGYGGHASAAGTRGHASAAGDGGHSSVKGQNSIAHAAGVNSTASACEGGAISLAAYDESVWPPKLVTVRSSMVGENGIEPGKSYRLTRDGQFVEVED